MNDRPHSRGPHDDAPVLTTGVPMEQARAGVILVHGRGADARDILGIAPEIDPGGVSFAAPDAASHSWYPYSFLAPLDQNEPGLSSALRLIHTVVERFQEAGVSSDRLLLAGFSQGACLALEYAVRNARAFGGVAGLSGGLIGPPGTTWSMAGSFDQTPVFLGCGDADAHIPAERVRESADVFARMGARVTTRLYPGMGHGINQDEVAFLRGMLGALVA